MAITSKFIQRKIINKKKSKDFIFLHNTNKILFQLKNGGLNSIIKIITLYSC